jgi:tRNA dimethylallyltransferase
MSSLRSNRLVAQPHESPFSQPVWVLTGPTGSGKSELALQVAERLGAEIVAMDSMTLYRGMDIGTAKPSIADRARIPHHLIDLRDPWESANVAWWLQQAKQTCGEIHARGRRVLFVGGTPLYIKALLHGIFDGPPADHAIRRRLEIQSQLEGPESLHSKLRGVDPITANKLHPNDTRRIVRALEVWELTGKPISHWQQQWDGAAYQKMINCCWLERPREELYSRINARVEQMIARGWVDEVSRLRQLPRPISREAGQALGYAEIGEYLDGNLSLDQAILAIQMRSRQFAKRQMTWFRHLPGCESIQVTGEETTSFNEWFVIRLQR